MNNIRLSNGQTIPLELHKVRIVQKLHLLTPEQRFAAITEAGNNTFLLRSEDCFLDMLTDSGVNAMSDRQQAAMLIADDSYAGSATFFRLEKTIQDIFGTKFFLPAHQGRAAENIITKTFVTPGSVSLMNHHFTTTRAHVLDKGGLVEEFLTPEGYAPTSCCPFKGNMDVDALKARIARAKTGEISFVRMEAGVNLTGGQPFSIENLEEVAAVCRENNLMLVIDASLWADNLYFIKTREEQCRDMTLLEITQRMARAADIVYFSARKLGCARGGAICTNNKEFADKMRPLVTFYEGFVTYGGMSVREMEALTVGLTETMDIDMISQGPEFIRFMTDELVRRGVPVITPAGGLGCHLNAMEFVDHIPQTEYRAGSLAAAIYLVSGCRGMERGTVSEDRRPDGSDTLANMELVRMALPRRVFTMSQVLYIVDRIVWLYQNRHLIGGLKFYEEPKILRFFLGKLAPTSDWQKKLLAKFKQDFGESN
jgi:tryptophanase